MDTSRHTNLFFMELIFSIFFFIVISVICLQIFSKAHFLNQQTKQLNFANEIIQNETELFYAHSNPYPVESEFIFYNASFQQVQYEGDAAFILDKEFTQDDVFQYANFSFQKYDKDEIQNDSDVIFSQSIKKLLITGGHLYE